MLREDFRVRGEKGLGDAHGWTRLVSVRRREWLSVRVCLVYDCLFPHTVGGAERWYRTLAERLAAAGHEVTYLTLRQWERGEEPAM